LESNQTPPLLLPSGVPGLDEVLGGGIPEAACVVIGGETGIGKTTLALQMAFANATPEQPVVYFCGPAEPPERLQQHHAQLKFFNATRLESEIQLLELGPHFTERNSSRVLDLLAREVQSRMPSMIVVDLPRTLTPASLWSEMQAFLAGCGITSLLIADGAQADPALEGSFSAADVVIWLERRDRGRSVQVLKVRGQTPMSGKHAAQFDWEGLRVFPRWPTPWRARVRRLDAQRVSTGVAGVDRLMGGGILAGGSVLVEGGSGTGKTIMATQFIAEGGHQGMPRLVLLLEERADRFVARAEALDLQLDRLIQGGLVDVLSLRGRDLSGDELLHVVQRAVIGIGAQSVVIDSISGLELLVDDVRDFVWRALDVLCGAGVTVWLTNTWTGSQVRSMVDDVLELRRFDERRHLEVVKSSHALTGGAMVAYEIGECGIRVLPDAEPRPSNGHLVNYRFAG
jgi:circadian clock protein KaiC